MPGPVLGWAGLVLSSGHGVEAGAQRAVRPKARRDYLGPTLLLGHWQAYPSTQGHQDCG